MIQTSPSASTNVRVFPDSIALAQAAAENFVVAARLAVAARGRFTCALAGGSTPKGLYTLLARPDFAGQVDWSKVELFWGDERCVAPDHADSNFRMVQESLLAPLNRKPQVHRMHGEIEPARGALLYVETLKAAFPEQAIPQLDLVLLGIGDDGHTASLFPGTTALEINDVWVTSTPPTETRGARLSLTFPVLNAAREVNFLVAGVSKQHRLFELVSRNAAGLQLPAARVTPTHGKLVWFADRDSARLLETSLERID